MMLVLVPLKIRASIVQDFAKSFDVGIRETVPGSHLEGDRAQFAFRHGGQHRPVASSGVLVFCVGVYFAAVVIYFSWTHLNKQLYALYLSRGGEPVPLSPKLS